MSLVKKDTKEQTSQINKVRITLTSRDPKGLEKVCAELLVRAKEQNIKIRGPVRLPTRKLQMVVRKSPCGNGSNTWDRFEMHIYKRLIDLYSPQEHVKQITAINVEAGVDVEVSVTDV